MSTRKCNDPDIYLPRLRALVAALDDRYRTRVGPATKREVDALEDEFGIGYGYVGVEGSLFTRDGELWTFESEYGGEPLAAILYASVDSQSYPSTYTLLVPDESEAE